ncbi:YbaK/EbsC family protein [Burkholderia anthina]|uniref:YbaK/EbsC family protein n=1 Tax=Burkholderia anthina TaxID=179879 RepID=UPI0037C190C1
MSGKNHVLSFLEARKIPFECEEHDAVLNMAESGLLSLSVVGARCKNLLLQDKKGHDFLVVTTAAKPLDLVALSETLGSKRLSFASADRLFALLGIRTGSLSPLALVNDEARHVRLVIDDELAAKTRSCFIRSRIARACRSPEARWTPFSRVSTIRQTGCLLRRNNLIEGLRV